jgi:hypothetical protein
MTATQRNNIANWIYKIFVASGVATFLIYGFIAEGRRMEKVEANESNIKTVFRKIDAIETKKADKDDITKIWEDVKYIRQRIDEHIARGK